MGDSRRSSGSPRDGPSAASSASSAIAVAADINEEEMYAGFQPAGSSASGPSPPASLTGSDPRQQSLAGTRITAEDSAFIDEDWDPDMTRYPESMSSSIRAHVYEGHLRYHAFREGKYAFPNDDVEQNRDDMKHAMTVMLMRGDYHYAPVADRLRDDGTVYDLGTGTGIWAIELSDKYPTATVRGCDLSPIQPNWLPENCYFAIDDFEDEWVYPENTFDYIHVRHTIHSIKDRRTLLQRIFRHLKPGGYVEFQELQYSPKCDDDSANDSTPYAFRDFMGFLEDGLRAFGSDLNSIAGLANELTEAGYDDVNERTHKCPIGVWPRDRRLRYIGLFMRTAILDGLPGLTRKPFGQGLGWTQLQIEMFLVDVRKALMNPNFHTYFPFTVVYGRKPLA